MYKHNHCLFSIVCMLSKLQELLSTYVGLILVEDSFLFANQFAILQEFPGAFGPLTRPWTNLGPCL